MIATKKKAIPKILLIGTGRFGMNHLRILKELHNEGRIVFKGAIVRDEKKAEIIKKDFNIEIFTKITPTLLKSVDAIDIVTPPKTHFEIVKKCLPYTNVFVEKPLTTNAKEAETLEKLTKKYDGVLIVGHIFRHHPVTKKLKNLLDGKKMPKKISGSFINPSNLDQGREHTLEFLHLFDIVDHVWGKDPKTVSGTKNKNLSFIDIRYENNHDAHFVLGCEGDIKIRKLEFKYDTYTIEADFISNTVTRKQKDSIKNYLCETKQDLLRIELQDFISSLTGEKSNSANAATGKRIISIAERAIPKPKKMPKVAIIGGGIFGTSVAAELAKFCSVTIFEKNNDLMQEGTYANCFRHHRGYHYPRSSETVFDIQNSCTDFENVYKKAIVNTYPTYYGLAKEGSYVSSKDFLNFCKKHNLPYKKEKLPSSLVSKEEIDLCIKVPEPGYNYEKLTSIVKKRLSKEPAIKIVCNALITKLSLEHNGSKTVTYTKKGKGFSQKNFNFVINATYANINRVISWLSFEQRPVRVDLAEVLIIKLPIPPISITIIDGPFTTLVPTGNKNEFTLYHVVESILDRYVPEDGYIKKDWQRKSNQEAILRESMKFLPVLKDAVVIESRIVHRGVQAHREHDDSRVVDLIDHKFGCFSILSGKILSSVTAGKKIAEIIKKTTK